MEGKDKGKGQGTKTLPARFFYYVGPSVLSMVAISLYFLCDIFFISGRMGAGGLAAFSFSLPVYGLLNGVGLMCGIGGSSRFAIFRVQGDRENMDRVFTAAVRIGLFLSVFLMIAGIFFSDRISHRFGAGGDLLPMTDIFIRTLLIFSPLFVLNLTLNAFVKNDGSPALAMGAILLSTLFHLVFDYLLITPARSGLYGAALSAGLSQAAGILILFFHLLSKKNQIRYETGRKKVSRTIEYRPDRKDSFLRRGAEPYRSTTERIFALGLPSLLIELSAGFVLIVFNHLFLREGGYTAVAAYAIVVNLYLSAQAVMSGIAQGSQPLLSEARARQDEGEEKKLLIYALLLLGGVSVLIYLVLVVLRGPVIGFFNHAGDPELASIARGGIGTYFLAVFFMGFNVLITMVFVVEGMGLKAQVITLLRGLIILLPAAFILTRLFGLSGAWAALPVTEALTAVLSFLIWHFSGRGDDPDIS